MLRPEEKTTLQNFCATCPDFAGRHVVCQEGPDPPDYICTDSYGTRIGFELAEWLHQEQMAASIAREWQEESFTEVIKSEEVDPPQNIGLILLETREGLKLKAEDAATFRKELYECIEELDRLWPQNPEWNEPQGHMHTDFSKYPCVAAHVQELGLRSQKRYPTILGIQWVCYRVRGGAYMPRDAVDALVNVIKKKTTMYSGLHGQAGLNELYLVVYYDRALIYNTPYFAPGFDFVDITKLAAAEVSKNPGPFQKVFLFNTLPQDREVIQLWP